MEIKLTEEQTKTQNELIKGINAIESAMSTVIDETNFQQVQYEIARRTELLGGSAKFLSFATALFDNAHGQVADHVLNTTTLIDAKQAIVTSWMKGKLAKWNALYVRTEQVTKKLDKSIDGLRSILSYEKALVTAGIHTVQHSSQ